jgi:hypothetical protein
MIWIAIAAQLTAAQPVQAANWFYDLAWEQRVSQKGGHALNFIRVIVTPDGRPQDCAIEVTSGIPDLDKETCALVMKRGRFKPARWADGKPAYGVYRKDVLWADLDQFEYSRPVDVEINVSRMPKGVRAPVSFPVNFAVDASGTKSSCQTPQRNVHSMLLDVACKQILASYPVSAARSAQGIAVPSVQNALVSFVTDGSK